jgi:hypothetical protein
LPGDFREEEGVGGGDGHGEWLGGEYNSKKRR